MLNGERVTSKFCNGRSSLSLFVFLFERRISMARNPEGRFQDDLRKRLFKILPGCKVFKMDQHQGIPDLLVLWRDKWALLECKAWRHAHKQPNQEYWVEKYGEMSFSRFINPENMEEVLRELQQTFGA